MRRITEIILHCTATREGRPFTVEDIRRWHLERGWSDIGYHYVVYLDGTVAEGRPVEVAGSHVAGRNASTIGVCYVGGLDRAGRAADTRTSAQKAALLRILMELIARFPSVTRIAGHNEYANKACPCFDAKSEYATLVAPRLSPPALTERYSVKAANANLRETPGGKVIGQLKRGVVMTATGVREGDWIEVTTSTRQLGWVHESVVDTRETARPAASSRIVRGGAVGLLSAVGSGASEAAKAIQPLVTYAEVFQWAFAALTVAAIVWMLVARADEAAPGRTDAEGGT